MNRFNNIFANHFPNSHVKRRREYRPIGLPIVDFLRGLNPPG
ncbi:MAG: hypothetical protein ACI4NO_01005 [Oxalobacter sp.]